MKKLQQFCATTVLTLALTLSAFAGEIGTPGMEQPPPPPHVITTGDIGTPVVIAKGDILPPGAVELDPLTEITLNLLQSLFSLF